MTHYEVERMEQSRRGGGGCALGPLGNNQGSQLLTPVTPGHLSKIPSQDREAIEALYYSPPVLKAFHNICFIAELLKKKDKDDKIDEDWKYVAMVLDRLFLWIFSGSCFLGTVIILLQAPTFYDSRAPIAIRAFRSDS